MEKLYCSECENETDFQERTIVIFSVNEDGEREDKVSEETVFSCIFCRKELKLETVPAPGWII
jgi:hypothetical protein